MKKRIVTVAVICAAAAALLGLYYFLYKRFGFGIPCLFNLITGLKCPGCGNTRAVDELLHLHFAEALSYNYMMPAEVLFILYVSIRSAVIYIKTGRRTLGTGCEPAAVVFLVVLIAWWIVRNIIGV
jgi:hypothetical protein